jgi:hypothetical protein
VSTRAAWLVGLGVLAGWVAAEWIDKAIARTLQAAPSRWWI